MSAHRTPVERALPAALIAALVAAIISMIISFVVLIFVLIGHATSSAEGPLLPCPTEDSIGCYWDADTMGNGQGNDVITLRDGVAEVMP